MNPFRAQIASLGESLGAHQPERGGGFNRFSAGPKRYGMSGRRGPNTGMTLDQSGYDERDRRTQLRRQLMLERMQANQAGNFNSAASLRPMG